MTHLTIQEAADMLQMHQDPAAVHQYAQQHPQAANVDAVLADIRSLWRDTHGDSAVKSSDTYRHGVHRIAQRLRDLACDSHSNATGANNGSRIKARVLEFLQLSFSEQYKAIGGLHVAADSSYTGCKVIDGILCDITVMPPYVKDLRVTGVSHYLPTMLAVINYPRAKPFELACALAFVSGRSFAELATLGTSVQLRTTTPTPTTSPSLACCLELSRCSNSRTVA